jgi:A/G-specific adenine glycosylase
LGDRQEFRDGAQAMKQLQPLANQLVDPRQPGDFNQAMMELGALICRKSSPTCELCPVADFCQSKGRSHLESIPKFAPKVRKTATIERLVVLADGCVLVRRYGAKAKRLGGMCELPTAESLQWEVQASPKHQAKRTIGTVTYTEKLYQVSLTKVLQKKVQQDAELLWIALTELEQVSLSGPHRQWLQRWFSQSDQPKRGRRL